MEDAYVRSVRWDVEAGVSLREFRKGRRLPLPAKIADGCHHGLSPGHTVMLANSSARLRANARCVKFKSGSWFPSGPWLSIPGDFDGWFEILSEEGRRIAVETSALRLKKGRRYLVRQATRVLLVGRDERVVKPGEVLEVRETNDECVECAVSSSGEGVFVPVTTKGLRFSAIVGGDDVSGLHSARALLEKRRLPIMVRLVHGKQPIGGHFAREMRIYSLEREEESLLALPLCPKKGIAVQLPMDAPIRVIAPKNVDSLLAMPEHASLVDRCSKPGASSGIVVCSDARVTCDGRVTQVSDAKSPYDARSKQCRDAKSACNARLIQHRNAKATFDARVMPCGDARAAYDNTRTLNEWAVRQSDTCPTVPLVNRSADSSGKNVAQKNSPEDARYDEIDQIYAYVRGFAPLPPDIENEFSGEDSVRFLPQLAAVSKPKKVTVSVVDRTKRTDRKCQSRFQPTNYVDEEISDDDDDPIYEEIDDSKRRTFETFKSSGNNCKTDCERFRSLKSARIRKSAPLFRYKSLTDVLLAKNFAKDNCRDDDKTQYCKKLGTLYL